MSAMGAAGAAGAVGAAGAGIVAVLCVGAGGFVGAVARYLLGLIPYQGEFPLITFAINFLGAVAIGAIAEVVASQGSVPTVPADSAGRATLSPNAVLFLKTGVCGGFTTFSTFSLETLNLLQKGSYLVGGLYAFGSLVVCVAGVVLGKLLARWLMGALGQGAL